MNNYLNKQKARGRIRKQKIKEKAKKKKYRPKKEMEAFSIELHEALSKIKIFNCEFPVLTAIKDYIEYNNITIENYDNFLQNKEFVERIFLNFIRHKYSNYDMVLQMIDHLPSVKKLSFKNKVNKKIKEKYKGFL